MTDRILQKYTAGRGPDTGGEGDLPDDADASDDLGSFGWLRGTRDRAVMLELRKKTGNALAVSYGWLERVEFDPSEGITLHLGGQKITIKGRNLNGEARPQVRLFNGVCRHRVSWIQEADQPTDVQADMNATVIETISW